MRQQLYDKSYEKVHAFITGAAGVGKSFLILAITNVTFRIMSTLRINYEIDPLSMKTLLCAPTAKAAPVINGVTIHSAFKLPLTHNTDIPLPLNSGCINSLRSEYQDVVTTIFDEASMVSLLMLHDIYNRCEQIFGFQALETVLSSFLFGDFYQLTPVKASSIFKTDRDLFAVPYSSVSSPYLWGMFKLYELKEIMRQRSDKRFAQLLTKFSRGSLENDEYTELQNICSTATFSDENSVHIFHTNREVDEFIAKKLNSLHTEFIECLAYDSGSKQNINSIRSKKRQETHGLETKLI